MKIGTKTLLYGGHQLFIHTFFVTLAWIKLYGLPNFEQFIAIVVHDLGYAGLPNIEGEEGKLHVELGSRIMVKLFGRDLYVAGHSRSYSAMKGIEVSKLCYADKYCWQLYPITLMVICAKLTGEIEEYLREANENTVSKEAVAALRPPYKNTFKDVRRFYVDIKKMSKVYLSDMKGK